MSASMLFIVALPLLSAFVNKEDLTADFDSYDPAWIPSQARRLSAISTQQSYCYPDSSCDLLTMSDGLSAVTFQGQPTQRLGLGMSGAGDINADGIADLIIGAPGASEITIVFGTKASDAWGNGTLPIANLTDGVRGFRLVGGVDSAGLGWSVSGGGDLNGDGISDVIIGTYQPFAGTGSAHVLFGSNRSIDWILGSALVGGTMNGQRGVKFLGENLLDQFGQFVRFIGDVNGDNVSDVLIGAHTADPGGRSDAGKAYVVFGSKNASIWGNGAFSISALMNGNQGFDVWGTDSNEWSAFSACGIDINGDNISDIVIGARQSVGTSLPGKVYVIFGSKNSSTWQGGHITNLTDLMDGQRGFLLVGEQANDGAGCSVANGGDLNGDGLDDLIVGAWSYDPVYQQDNGRTYVVFGSRNSSAWSSGVRSLNGTGDGRQGVTLQGEKIGDASGYSVSSAGDINSDGCADLFIGAPLGDSNALTDAGQAYVVFGTKDPIVASAAIELKLKDGRRGFVLNGGIAGEWNGATVSSAGDINGDGVDDLVMGSLQGDNAYLVFGARPNFVGFASNYLQIGFRQTIVLDTGFLNIFSVDPGHNINDTVFVIDNLVGGSFTFVDFPLASVLSFSMQNVSDRRVQFSHTAGVPSYRIVACKTKLCCSYSDASVMYVGDIPTLTANKLTISQGAHCIFSPLLLNAIDLDNPMKDLSFILRNITRGHFVRYVNSTPFAYNFDTFDLLDVVAGQVVFVHDGSIVAPSYEVAVKDLISQSAFQPATVSFNRAPELFVGPSPIVFDQGISTILHGEDLNASDLDTFRESLFFDVVNVTHGYFAYVSAPNLAIVRFQQLSLTAGTVQFVHDDSVNVPRFEVRAADESSASIWYSPLTQLNYRPVLHGYVQDQQFNFEVRSDLFSDVNDTLSFYAQRRISGAPQSSLPAKILFTPPRRLSGNLPTATSYVIEIEARDTRQLSITTSFIISSLPVYTFNYERLTTVLSSVAGTVVTMMAYLWLRRRIAKHRRDFFFANSLRKVLNLEYYDFSRFDGDTFKAKVDLFLLRLQLEHQDFYSQLTQDERKRFAVCVSEILVRRGLVFRSDSMSGMFGILCMLNVGWPSELNLAAFEAQSLDIAAESVMAWRNALAAQKDFDKPLSRWQYVAPSKREKCTVFCCCAKPATATRWRADAYPSSGIALTSLKRYASEAASGSSETKGDGEGLTSKVMLLQEQI